MNRPRTGRRATAEVERIRDQLRRAMEGDAWHGPGLRELLAGVTATRASDRMLPGRHTIQELVLHVAAWFDAVARRVPGRVVELASEEDWPEPDASEEGWEAAKGLLEQSYARLDEAISTLEDRDLDRTVAGKPFTLYVMLHGVVQHALYHAGQIALLRPG